mmetsp:Transcript_26187/g.39648  ORF Transcript_26187/g.39648 Transcript_26187/m.39648 type:complete len:95 (-) Transcript_26187:2047-2331(-)
MKSFKGLRWHPIFFLYLWDPFAQVAAANNGGTQLGAGLVTRTNVEMYADIALDVRDIREAISFTTMRQPQKYIFLVEMQSMLHQDSNENCLCGS